MNRHAERNFLLSFWLASAAIVTALRFFQAVDPGYDVGLQLQAAHNLLAGRGLGTFLHLGPDLSHPSVLVPLTYFPAGYSLAAAAFLSAGFGVGTTVKLLGAAATMLGWWGWGRLAQSFIGEGVTRPLWRWAAVIIAISAPLLFTLPWGGTDIFLWAVVPWVIECTVRASNGKTRQAWRFDWLAGTLCGFAFLMRYASAFLAAYVVGVVLWQSRLRVRESLSRSIAFGVGLLPALLLQGYLDYFPTHESPLSPGGLLTNHASILSRLETCIALLRNANYLWAFWIPGKIAGLLFPARGNASPFLLGLLLVSFALLLLAFETYRRALKLTPRDSRLVMLGLFPAIPVFLCGCMLLSATNYLGDVRYFSPLIPLSVLVAYSIALIGHVQQRPTSRLLGPIAALYTFGYVGTSLVFVFFLFMPGSIGTTERSRVMPGSLEHWPSMAVTYEYWAGRRFVLEQLKEDPQAVLVMSKGAAFYWDPAFDASRIRQIDCGGSEPRYVEGPVRLLIFTFDEGAADQVWWYAGGNSTFGHSVRAACFERLQGRRLLRRFPDEGMKLLEAYVAPGQRISLN